MLIKVLSVVCFNKIWTVIVSIFILVVSYSAWSMQVDENNHVELCNTPHPYYSSIIDFVTEKLLKNGFLVTKRKKIFIDCNKDTIFNNGAIAILFSDGLPCSILTPQGRIDIFEKIDRVDNSCLNVFNAINEEFELYRLIIPYVDSKGDLYTLYSITRGLGGEAIPIVDFGKLAKWCLPYDWRRYWQVCPLGDDIV